MSKLLFLGEGNDPNLAIPTRPNLNLRTPILSETKLFEELQSGGVVTKDRFLALFQTSLPMCQGLYCVTLSVFFLCLARIFLPFVV